MSSITAPHDLMSAVRYALQRMVPLDEADLRLRAVRQMEDRVASLVARHGELPRWSEQTSDGVIPARAEIVGEVERLCGEHGPADALRAHASFLALMFYEECSVGSWWASPLGVLCDRALRTEEG